VLAYFIKEVPLRGGPEAEAARSEEPAASLAT
jgi:hypothetical protein